MLIFFSLAVLLVVIALGILLPGLFLDRPVVTAGRDTKNITIARERLTEIEADLERGIINGDKYDTLREEIERNLVDDLSGEAALSEASRGGQGQPWPLPSCCRYWLPGSISPSAHHQLLTCRRM